MSWEPMDPERPAIVLAGHSSRCGMCQELIEKGDQIVCVDDEWACRLCAEDEGAI